jgi:hypothetical protein
MNNDDAMTGRQKWWYNDDCRCQTMSNHEGSIDDGNPIHE